MPADFNAWYHTSKRTARSTSTSTYFNEMTKASVATFADMGRHSHSTATGPIWTRSGQVTVADIMKVTTHWLASLGQLELQPRLTTRTTTRSSTRRTGSAFAGRAGVSTNP